MLATRKFELIDMQSQSKFGGSPFVFLVEKLYLLPRLLLCVRLYEISVKTSISDGCLIPTEYIQLRSRMTTLISIFYVTVIFYSLIFRSHALGFIFFMRIWMG